MGKVLDLTLRISLWMLFVAAAVNAVLIGWVGLAFGFSLWDATNPLPTAYWLAALAFPILLFKFTPRSRSDGKRLLLVWLAAWAFAAYYVLFALGEGHILDCDLRWSC